MEDEFRRTLPRTVRVSNRRWGRRQSLSSPHERFIHIGPAIPEELPSLAHFADHIEIEIGGQHFILIARGLGDDLAAGVTKITAAIKLTDVPWRFDADTVD